MRLQTIAGSQRVRAIGCRQAVEGALHSVAIGKCRRKHFQADFHYARVACEFELTSFGSTISRLLSQDARPTARASPTVPQAVRPATAGQSPRLHAFAAYEYSR